MSGLDIFRFKADLNDAWETECDERQKNPANNPESVYTT